MSIKEISAEQQEMRKPDCPLIGQDGNIFNLMGIASRTLRRNGLSEQRLRCAAVLPKPQAATLRRSALSVSM